MSGAPTLRTLWDDFSSTEFPRELADSEQLGSDLVTVDADIAGCVAYALANGRLDSPRRRILGERVGMVTSLAAELPDDTSRAYVTRLADLARCALTTFPG